MKISAKAEYACLAILDLALLHGRPQPARVADLAERNDIPERFLVQILLQLKGAGYVQSARGATGGYRLAVLPEALSVWDVIQSVDGAPTTGWQQAGSKKGSGWDVLQKVWFHVSNAEEITLRQTDFAKLVKQATQLESQMFHI